MKRVLNIWKRTKVALVTTVCLSSCLLSVGCVPPAQDVHIHIQASAQAVMVGDDLTYTIIATNTLDTAREFDVTQTFSLPVEILNFSIEGGSSNGTPYCEQENNTVVCRNILTDLYSSEARINVSVRASTLGSLTSTATLEPSLIDIDVDFFRRSASTTTAVSENCCADMSITLADDGSDPVALQGFLTYTITITNNGRNTATDVRITDALPAPIDRFISPGLCQQSDGKNLACEFGSIPSGESRVTTVTVRPTQPGVLTNTATLTTTTFDPDIGNNSDTETTTVMPPEADLEVTMTGDPDSVVVGNNVTYTVNVVNNGPARATNVRLVDTLPTNADLISITPSKGSCSISGICDLGAIDGDARETLSVVVRSQVVGTVINRVRVIADEHDPDNTNDSALVETTVSSPSRADLSVAISVSPDQVIVGNNLTYTITLTNNGPDMATNVFLTDTLPQFLQVISVTPSRGSCTGSQSGGTLTYTCDLDAIDRGAHATVTIVVNPTVVGTVINRAYGFLSNEAIHDEISIDPYITNNTAELSTEIFESTPEADLAVTMSDAPDPVVVGNDLSYTITVRNNGPSRATSITLTDTLPSGVAFVSATSDQGSCTQGGGLVTCELSPGPADPVCPDCAIVTVVVRPTSAGPITNTASVTAHVRDPNPVNNSVEVITEVNEALVPDLEVVVIDWPDPVVVDQPLTYFILVKNNGLGAANGLTLTATLPSSVIANVNPDFLNCSPDGNGNLVCQTTGGVLDIGEETWFTLNVTPTAVGEISIGVNVTTPGTDANPADNTFTESTTVDPPAPTADLSIRVEDSPDPVIVDQTLNYYITVTNNGLSTATGITLYVILPTSVISNLDPSQFCAPFNGQTACTFSLASLSNGDASTFTLPVTPTATGTISMTAWVSARETDPNNNNNTAPPVETFVSSPQTTADLEIVSVSDSPDPAIENQDFIYTITLRNNGLGTATGVAVTNTLSSGVTSVGGDCHGGSGPVIQCLQFNMASGSTRTITWRARSSVTGPITNTVNVSALETDPDPTNNTRGETTTINPATSADLFVTMAAVPNPVQNFNNLTYTIVVQNTGPEAATGISLTGFTAESLEVIDITPTQGTCSWTPHPLLTCSLGTLASGGSVTVTITALPFDLGLLNKTVTATTSSLDPNLVNNSASVSTTVN